ncbi:MAG: hypothetical protein IT379_15150 [Deltaproteobacteria bacterium]|nr:hypothetical protein [Deltaproteobacteria bacterium]
MRRSLLAVALAMGAAGGCAAPMAGSEATVIVDGTTAVRERARAFDVIVLAEPERRLLLSDLVVVPRDGELPIELPVVAGPDDPDPLFDVIVRAYGEPTGESEPIAAQRLLATFDRDRPVSYWMLLEIVGDAGADAESMRESR